MKKTIRILALILALLMIVPTIVACGDDTGDDDPAVDGTTASTQGGEQVVNKVLPDLNWEGAEYRILGREYTSIIFQNFEVDRDELSRGRCWCGSMDKKRPAYEQVRYRRCRNTC